MTNMQLFEAVIARAQEEAAGATRSEDSLYETLEAAFVSALRDSLRETKETPEFDSDFRERVVGNFIIAASNDGFTAPEIQGFLAYLSPGGSN